MLLLQGSMNGSQSDRVLKTFTKFIFIYLKPHKKVDLFLSWSLLNSTFDLWKKNSQITSKKINNFSNIKNLCKINSKIFADKPVEIVAMKLESDRPLLPSHRLPQVRRGVAVHRLADADLAAADFDQWRVAFVAAVVDQAHVQRLQVHEHLGYFVRQVGFRLLFSWWLLKSNFYELLRCKIY